MTGFAAVAVGVGALLVGFAAPYGNGIEDASAREIIDRGRQELHDARSVHMVAKVADPAGTTTLDLRFDVEGNCTGSVALPRDAGRADIVKRGEEVWLKPDDAFLRSQAPGGSGDDAVALIDGRWIHGSAGNAVLREFRDLCDLSAFQRTYASRPAGGERVAKGRPAEVAGTPAITATSASGADRSTYYVATEGEPRLLRVEGTQDGQRGSADFSDYDVPVPAATPAASESVDLSTLR
ncbi:hypothetical protein [Streptomyces sp. WAC06614]|uniref:hypothetical protein n=1 Tax=Streptomyces sp. WAC06614 TaxID=2487416 RepID=UPI000F7A07D2|nr:hypothetical protein [Streptomyces sp. WAC06614]RSS56123.1 hypothetical protein EF918_34440 [Streptomyces sp. WAC06614]